MVTFLKSYVSEFGKEAIFNTDKLREYLIKMKADKKCIYQIVLLLSCDNLRDYVERNSEEMETVEINNIVSGCVVYTGMNIETIKRNIRDILLALEIDCAYEQIFIYEEKMDKVLTKNTAFIPYEETISVLKLADAAFENASYQEAFNIYIRLAKSGQPQAMYKLGQCYMDGIGTEKSEQKALNWLLAAAQNGDPNARAKLGDYYYYNTDILKRDFQKAYDYYSGVGVVSVNQYAKGNIVNMLNQKKVNFIVLILGAILLLLIWMFAFFFNASVHNSYNLMWLGIITSILSTLIYVCSVLYYRIFKYNNIKFFITAMTVLWGIYAVVLTIN